MNRQSFVLALLFFSFTAVQAQDNYIDFSVYTFNDTPVIASLEVEDIVAEEPSVSLNSFEVVDLGASTLIRWESDFEKENDAFLIQRSTDGGTQFRTIGEISGANTASEYIFIDDTDPKTNTRYRLAQLSYTGAVFFFNL